jgi:basic amino acid/polyamine antiporter, APA family
MVTDKKQKIKKSGKGKMKRTLGVASVFAICTGAAFSSGFFLLPGFAADETGPSLPLAFLVAGFLMLPTIYTISELSSAMPRSGGPYFFMTRSFGPLIGIFGAVGKYVQLLLKGAFAFVGAGVYFSLIMDANIKMVALILIGLFTVINLMGIKQTATTEKILVAVLILLLTYFVLAGIAQIYSEDFDFENEFQPLLPFGMGGFFSAIALVFVSYGGMGQVASVAEEIKNPARSIPKGMMRALWVSTFFYVAGTIIMIALVSGENLRDNMVPAATAAEQINTIPLPVIVMVLAALAAFASTGNAAVLSAARYPLALSRDKLVWNKFSDIDKKGIPKYAVFLTGILLTMLVLLFDVQEIAKLASAFLLFVFMGMCLALIVFRESKSKEYKPEYKTPLYPWMQIAGTAIYLSLIIISGLNAVLFILAVMVISSLWFYFGIRESTTFSAAVYPLFGRIARSGMQGTGNAEEESGFVSLVKRAIFIEPDEKISVDEAIREAAHAIRERLGGEREKIEQILHDEVKHWMHKVKFNISVAPVLLEGINQPEMIIMKGKIKIDEGSSNGLIILLDDRKASARMLKLTTQFEAVIKKEKFHEAWEKAESANEIKKSLLEE